MLSKNKISYLKSLETKKGRDEHGMFIAEGPKIVEELLRSDIKVMEVFALPSYHPANQAGKPVFLVPVEITEAELKKISGLNSPNQILAVAEIPQRNLDPLSLRDKLTLVLEDIRDPGNMGTIIRTADWFGIENIICSFNTVDCYNPKVIQASMGSIARVKIHFAGLEQFLSALNAPNALSALNAPLTIYGTVLDGKNIYTQPLSPAGLILIGNESKGISAEIQKMLSHKISIPDFSYYNQGGGEAESLNAAVAAGIICAEFRRRKY